jgi:hypothetical protein
MAPGFHELSTFLPGCPVMVFHRPDNSADLNPDEAVASGVRGVLMKSLDCSELSGAVRRVRTSRFRHRRKDPVRPIDPITRMQATPPAAERPGNGP